MSVVSKIINTSFGINGLKKIVSIFTGFIFLVLSTRYLGAELKGEYAYILNWVNIATTTFNFGLTAVFPYFIKKNDELNENDFFSISVYQFFIYVVVSLLLFILTENYVILYICILSALAILNLQITNISLITSLKVNTYSAILSAIVNVTLMTLAFAYLSTYLEVVLIIFVIKLSSSILYCWSFLGVRLKPIKKSWLRVLKTGFLPMLITFLIALNYKMDILMLKYLDVDLALIGIFAVGVSLAEYSWMIPDIFKEVMLNKNSQKDNIELMNLSLRSGFTIVLVFSVFFICFGKFLIEFLFGSEFNESFIYTTLMFMAVPFMVFVKIVGTLFLANGKYFKYFKILIITVLANLVLNFFLIPKYNVYGAIYASIFSYTYCGLSCLLWYSKKYDIKMITLFLLNYSDIKLIISRIKP